MNITATLREDELNDFVTLLQSECRGKTDGNSSFFFVQICNSGNDEYIDYDEAISIYI